MKRLSHPFVGLMKFVSLSFLTFLFIIYISFSINWMLHGQYKEVLSFTGIVFFVCIYMRFDLLFKVKSKLFFDDMYLYINKVRVKLIDIKSVKRVYSNYYKIVFQNDNIKPVYFINVRFFSYDPMKKFVELVENKASDARL